MTTRRPALLRWAEIAEAEQMCATAVLERESQNVAACPLAVAPGPVSARHPRALLSWLRGWLGGERMQMARDGGH